jgi:hypothetical protein
MKYYSNHCWCSSSNWGGNFDCRYIIGIDRIKEGKTYYDTPEEDWTNLIDKIDGHLNVKEYQNLKNNSPDMDDESLKSMATRPTYRLNKEVLEWLTENVKDIAKGVYAGKGWCIGSDDYNANSSLKFSIFFRRRRDAMNFVKVWSSYKKPVTYFDYFKDIRKELNPKTNTLQVVED